MDLKKSARNVFVDVRNLKILKCLSKHLPVKNSLDMTHTSNILHYKYYKHNLLHEPVCLAGCVLESAGCLELELFVVDFDFLLH